MERINGLDPNKVTIDGIDAEVTEIEKHFHNRERWFGKLAVQTATDWGEQAGLTPYRAISGLGVFGADANDAAQVLGLDDTPAIAGMTRWDAHRIKVHAASNANQFVLRLVYGAGTMADAEAAGQYSDTMISEARKGGPVPVLMPRARLTDKMWLRAKNATDNAWIDFFIGIHEYLV